MQIDRIELYRLSLPLAEPIATPLGPWETLETTLVRICSGDVCGWGEVSPGNLPIDASGEWTDGATEVIRTALAPRLVGRSLETPDDFQAAMAAVGGNPHAKAALDNAYWDCRARKLGKPLAEFIAQQCRAAANQSSSLPVAFVVDEMETTEQFLETIGDAIDAGTAHIKSRMRPGWAIEMITGIRSVYPMIPLWIDVMGQLELAQIDLLQRLDDFMIDAVEQPFSADELVGHAILVESIATPVSLDESITTAERLPIVADLKACRFVNLKPTRLGGITPALSAAQTARESEIGCYTGGSNQTAIGARASLAFALAVSGGRATERWIPQLPEEINGVLPYPELTTVVKRATNDYEQDRDILHIEDWSEPGIGIEPSVESLKDYLVESSNVVK